MPATETLNTVIATAKAVKEMVIEECAVAAEAVIGECSRGRNCVCWDHDQAYRDRCSKWVRPTAAEVAAAIRQLKTA